MKETDRGRLLSHCGQCCPRTQGRHGHQSLASPQRRRSGGENDEPSAESPGFSPHANSASCPPIQSPPRVHWTTSPMKHFDFFGVCCVLVAVTSIFTFTHSTLSLSLSLSTFTFASIIFCLHTRTPPLSSLFPCQLNARPCSFFVFVFVLIIQFVHVISMPRWHRVRSGDPGCAW